MKNKYIVSGSVRGQVSSNRTLAAALKSLQRDQRSCAKQGGYSDCSIRRADGSSLSDAEFAVISPDCAD